MKLFAALPLVVLTAPAAAHPGHFAESAGHTHWLALVALAGAFVIVLATIVRRPVRRRRLIAHD